MANYVYIATSLDGYIAKTDGDINWLHEIPNPEGSDFGFSDFMNSIDALLMGRNTYEKVLSFEGEWPYSKKVFVLSSKLSEVPKKLEGKVELVSGEITEVVKKINDEGFKKLYIDGGRTIQGLLSKNLIDEITISRIPILLGEGIPLFSLQSQQIKLTHIKTEAFNNGIVKSHYTKSE